MHANAEKTRFAIEEIRSLRDRISELLSDTPDFQTRAEHVLDTLANGLSFAIGDRSRMADQKPVAPRKTGPRTIMGHPVPEVSPITQQVAAIQPNEGEVAKLREDVAEAYGSFPNLTNKEIRNTLSDLEIRGVAKKAGLWVTKTEPAHITEEFLNQIRQAMADKAAHQDAVLEADKGAQAIVEGDNAGQSESAPPENETANQKESAPTVPVPPATKKK